MTRASLLPVLLAVLCGGCGAGYQQLPERALRGLPVEGRRWLFDAENSVIAALDSVDVAREHRREAQGRVQQARRSLDAARKRTLPSGAELGVTAAQAALAVAEAGVQLAEAQVALARSAVAQARLDLELDKARLVVRYDLAAERGFSLQPYEAQSAAATRSTSEQQHRVDALTQKVQALAEQARSARQQYVTKSGDHDSGVWLD